jgi:protein-S-isoprenylcysteine O-methyltransferase Ste14
MSTVWVFVSVVAFGAIHSLLASPAAKGWARRRLGQRRADGTYRLFYNVVAMLTILPSLALAVLLPDGRPVWRIPAPLLFITIPVQLAALAGMMASAWRVDLPRFVGLRQFRRLLAGHPEPRDLPVLRTDGIHGWVRHPLYFFSLVLIWLIPVMTPNFLALDLGLSLYLWLGSILEERKLVQDFGDDYRAHQARVPRLFPWPRRPHRD